MIRRKSLLFCLISLLCITRSGLYAQSTSSVSATGHVFAEVIAVFSATETSQMNFGRFSPGPSGGEIVLTPQGSISVIGSIYVGAGTHNPASFYISGDSDASFTVSLPDDPVILRHSSSPKTMVIDEWLSVPGPGPGAGILQDGSQVVYVGATLKVGSLQDNPVGVYSGTYSITFDFN
jgi:hypothetical protein